MKYFSDRSRGSRDNRSATGWSIRLCYQRGDGAIHYRLVIAHGSFLKERVTSFVSELVALKEAVDYLTTSLIGAKVPIHQVS